MSEELKVLKSNAVDAYEKADTNGKSLLSNLLGKKHFLSEVTDRIKTFEDACEALNLDSTHYNFRIGTDYEIAYKKLKVICEALNEGWKPDWNNSSEYKWYPWFYMNNPGFRFYNSFYDNTYACTTGGSRLCFKTEKLSTYAAKQFLEEYKIFMY